MNSIKQNKSGLLIRFDFCQHLLKAGTVKVCSTVSVIHKEYRIRETMLFCKCFEDAFLVLDGKRLSKSFIFLGQTAVQCRDLISCP